MAVDDTIVRRVGRLARIAFTDAEVPPLVGELNNILGWIDQLSDVDTDGVEPMSAVIPKPSVLRADMVTEGGQRDAVLSNAPAASHGYFAVPKVIE
jgi:aspartyl-tRNA(Asn)/glutamyl-tRNA(Gln) amidotransferase subunit C